MNPDLSKLQPYPFERLRQLKLGITPKTKSRHISLSIGEPKHKPPGFINDLIVSHLSEITQYPATKGLLNLRESIANWLISRFKLNNSCIDPERNILPVCGTREALFSIAQTIVNRADDSIVVIPNPFYQIYEGATVLSGAQPFYLNTTQSTKFIPDFSQVPPETWQQCQLLYICSPGNPTGAVINIEILKTLIELAHKYNFTIASDECYSEIYFNESQPPVGLLQASFELGNKNFSRCLVFHSLSKRSNVPGMRSGFVAGDPDIIEKYFLYRTYHGCSMPPFIQQASISAWQDESHVKENRKLYKEKFEKVSDLLKPHLDFESPEAAFYLWPKVPMDDDTVFAQQLYAHQNVTVLPGSYLSRSSLGVNPGQGYVRIALVAEIAECVEAAERICEFIQNL